MTDIADRIRTIAAERILVFDGAWGTSIQNYSLDEAGYRGDRDFRLDQKGNNDLLCLTRPEIVEEITTAYLDAGADIVSTNTFSGTTISQADYGDEALVHELNVAAAEIARRAADRASTADKPRFVAGSIGPTNKTLSLSPDVNDPGFREVDFDQMKSVYAEQIDGLIEGGVDMLLVETIFDTLNAKAAIMAAHESGDRHGRSLPLILSMTITDMSGRNLSGHSIEAFWAAVRHSTPLAIGLNCSFGADRLRPHMQAISDIADTLVIGYPNAGLPNELGEYDEEAEHTRDKISQWVDQGLVNIVGGCCGTTPAHIRAIAEMVEGKPPRAIAAPMTQTFLAGLEPMTLAA
ncbi:5-methyltetrahydrofolate--homocysteine methyltransferase [Parasphingopyxis algicola]|uniref:homocysteine S-methyltransferase family protein n=1 Tax=Parasphingopyxis algicola TaxID=2026624 RepID=UPI0015A1F87F|nr:homocysteine S-methyltransferase family protein [Parasphingopyxis algicola]QLC25095.1 5-methyltetrahydrofolate--homocysteine methyltransferase [Parasphingopyxis algicola]